MNEPAHPLPCNSSQLPSSTHCTERNDTMRHPINPARHALAAVSALMLLSFGAAAQEATDETAAAPAATELTTDLGALDTSIPGLEETAVAAEPASTAAFEAAPAATDEPAAAEEEGEAFSMQALWTEGDIVARSTLIMMVLMSLATWYIVATKYVDQMSLLRQSRKLRDFWSSDSVAEGLDSLGKRNAFAGIAQAAMSVSQDDERGLQAHISATNRVSHRVVQSVEGVNSRLSSGMAVLATVGSISPFVGLFGTVWGIVNALIAIGVSGQASIDKVAGPVGEALYMTAIGLFVAVPAVVAYNLLGRRNKVIQDTARHFALDLEQLFTRVPVKV
jgi:biopolymer transport protein ExbB